MFKLGKSSTLTCFKLGKRIIWFTVLIHLAVFYQWPYSTVAAAEEQSSSVDLETVLLKFIYDTVSRILNSNYSSD